MVAEKEKNETKQKPIKKYEKYIWFAISLIIAAIGAICHINGIAFNIWISVIYSALLLFSTVMAAQRTSIQRFECIEKDEPKIKYALITVLYYIFIIFAVFYAFLALWIAGVFSI